MSYSWNCVRRIATALSFLLLFGAISTSDYYVIELGQTEPAYVGGMFCVALLLMIPQIIHIITFIFRRYNNENYLQD